MKLVLLFVYPWIKHEKYNRKNMRIKNCWKLSYFKEFFHHHYSISSTHLDGGGGGGGA
jgi:hypothetical protein